MPSISDLGKPASPENQPNSLLAEAARDAVLKRQSDRIAETAKLLSTPFPTTLGEPRTKIHEVVIEQSPAIAMMREQVARARRQELDAQRPWWKKAEGWSLIISVVSLIVAIVALSDFKFSISSLWTYLTDLLVVSTNGR